MRAALDSPGVEHVALHALPPRLAGRRRHAEPTGGRQDAAAGALPAVLRGRRAATLRRAMPAAAAIELLHNFTLIHDDIEDGSETRHGRADALARRRRAAGDQRRRRHVRARAAHAARARTTRACRRSACSRRRALLDDACIALCEGQYADLGFESRDRRDRCAEYEAMIARQVGRRSSRRRRRSARSLAARDDGDGRGVRAMRSAARTGVPGPGRRARHLGRRRTSPASPSATTSASRKKSFPVVYALEHLDADGRAELRAHLRARTRSSDAEVDARHGAARTRAARATPASAQRGGTSTRRWRRWRPRTRRRAARGSRGARAVRRRAIA